MSPSPSRPELGPNLKVIDGQEYAEFRIIPKVKKKYEQWEMKGEIMSKDQEN